MLSFRQLFRVTGLLGPAVLVLLLAMPVALSAAPRKAAEDVLARHVRCR